MNPDRIFFIWFVRLLALRPLLAYCARLGYSEDDCGEAYGMQIGRENRSSRRKLAPASLLSITKSHMTRPRFEPGPPQWEAGDLPPELWRGPKTESSSPHNTNGDTRIVFVVQTGASEVAS
jgi:hypothetical protein